jgi:hypothetical protein
MKDILAVCFIASLAILFSNCASSYSIEMRREQAIDSRMKKYQEKHIFKHSLSRDQVWFSRIQ